MDYREQTEILWKWFEAEVHASCASFVARHGAAALPAFIAFLDRRETEYFALLTRDGCKRLRQEMDGVRFWRLVERVRAKGIEQTDTGLLFDRLGTLQLSDN